MNKHVSPKIWDDKKERAKGSSPASAETNDFIDQYKKKILSYIDFMILDNQPVTAQIIQDKLVGKKKIKVPSIDFTHIQLIKNSLYINYEK